MPFNSPCWLATNLKAFPGVFPSVFSEKKKSEKTTVIGEKNDKK
jgi:hypothetical protein